MQNMKVSSLILTFFLKITIILLYTRVQIQGVFNRSQFLISYLYNKWEKKCAFSWLGWSSLLSSERNLFICIQFYYGFCSFYSWDRKSSVLLEQGLQDQEVTIVPLNEKIEDLHISALSVLESKQNLFNQFWRQAWASYNS